MASTLFAFVARGSHGAMEPWYDSGDLNDWQARDVGPVGGFRAARKTSLSGSHSAVGYVSGSGSPLASQEDLFPPDVGRFQVAVDDAFLVRRFESLGDLKEERQCLIDRNRTPLDPLGQRLALDQLHDEEAGVSLSLEAVEGGDGYSPWSAWTRESSPSNRTPWRPRSPTGKKKSCRFIDSSSTQHG